jgi:hypothetical protein
MTQIVTVNVAQTVAPTPSQLQKTGALISNGGTTTVQGTKTPLTAPGDLTAILAGSHPLTSLTQSAGTATATTTSPHGYTNGETVALTIAGASPAGYNGTIAALITGASTFTYPVNSGLSSPATGSIVFTAEDVAELLAMVTTFFAQGSRQAVYVLELGELEAATAIAYLGTWINASKQFFYSYLVPRAWSAESTWFTFLAGFENDTSKTYFFCTATTGNYTSYTALMKCAFVMIEAAGIPATEFSCAAPFYVTLNYTPSSTNRVTPTAYSFLFGVTPYPEQSNAALLTTLAAASINVVGTGSEGNISDAILLYGTLKDGNDFNYWYSIDWVQINIDLNCSAAVINGSNNPSNPLYLSQDGINRIQAVAFSTMSSGVSDGLVLGAPVQTQYSSVADMNDAIAAGQFPNQTVVNAIPFLQYYRDNPNDYAIGKYAGYTIVYTPSRGFKSIIFNVNVTQFVTP